MVWITLDLGPLVRLERVLDGKRVESQRITDLEHLVLGRVTDADPEEVVLAETSQCVVE